MITTTYSPLGLWQYTEYQTGEHELYDVSNGPCWTWQPGSTGDPCELQNVAGNPQYASVESSLRQRLAQLKPRKGHTNSTGGCHRRAGQANEEGGDRACRIVSSEPARCLRIAPARGRMHARGTRRMCGSRTTRAPTSPSTRALHRTRPCTAAISRTRWTSRTQAPIRRTASPRRTTCLPGSRSARSPLHRGTCTESAGVVTCDLGTLASGDHVTVTIVVTADQVGPAQAVASVSSTTADPDLSNNDASAQVTVEPAAALAVTQADSPDPAHVGEDVTYTVQVHNDGPDNADAVTLTDTLPGGSTFETATPSTGTCSETAGTVTCDLGSLAAAGDASVAITVKPDAAGTSATSPRSPRPPAIPTTPTTPPWSRRPCSRLPTSRSS